MYMCDCIYTDTAKSLGEGLRLRSNHRATGSRA